MDASQNIPIRTRKSLRELEKPENEKELNNILKAFKILMAMPYDDPSSFWAIAGLHGAPYNVKKNKTWCQHWNVLFPTWHRFYLLKLEQAMRAVSHDVDIALPYWDATSDESLKEGLPKILTQPTVTIDGKTEDNPFLGFTFPVPIDVMGEVFDKPAGYKTLRYPYCQLQNAYGENHNKKMAEHGDQIEVKLNEHIISWLNQGGPGTAKTNGNENSVYKKYKDCLKATSYFYFSHVRKGAQVSVESPHNSVHMAVGGAEMRGDGYDSIDGASGDMGQTDTASFDPIFWFHHCNVDRMFWVWQKEKGYTETFEIDAPEGKELRPPNDKLDLDTPLEPFLGWNGLPVTSRDCMNIEKQLHYTYSIGSLDPEKEPEKEPARDEFVTEKIEITADEEDEASGGDASDKKDPSEEKDPDRKSSARAGDGRGSAKPGGRRTSLKNDDKAKPKNAKAKPAARGAAKTDDKTNPKDPKAKPSPRGPKAEDKAKPVEKKAKPDPKASGSKDKTSKDKKDKPVDGITIIHKKGPKDIQPKGKMDKKLKPISQRVRISNIDKTKYTGSFLLRLSKKKNDAYVEIGQEAIFNRWNRAICENCHFTQFANAVFILPADAESQTPKASDYKVEVIHWDIEEGVKKTDKIKVQVQRGKKGGPVMRIYNIYGAIE